MITLIIDLNVSDKDYVELKNICKSLTSISRLEEGCLSYDMFFDKDKLVISLVERWKSQEALELHKNSTHYKSLVPTLKELTVDSHNCVYSN